MRILLTKLKHIGDALLMTPTICAIRERYPGAEIVVVVRKGTEEILAGCPEIDCVLTAAAPEHKRRSALNWIEDGQMIAELRRKEFDYAFDLSDGDRGRWVCALARVKVRCTNDAIVKMHRAWKLVFKSISRLNWECLHRVEKDFLTVAHVLDLGEKPPGLSFAHERTEASWASELAGVGAIVFHPATRLPEKQWPEERWIELGCALKSPGGRIVVSVGPAEAEVALGERIAAGIGREAFSTKGNLNWAQLARLLHAARLFVGVDTAAMHLAAACGCPVVAIFGMTSVAQWRPWSGPNRVLSSLPETLEIAAAEVRDNNPIERIAVGAVLHAADELMRNSAARAETR